MKQGKDELSLELNFVKTKMKKPASPESIEAEKKLPHWLKSKIAKRRNWAKANPMNAEAARQRRVAAYLAKTEGAK